MNPAFWKNKSVLLTGHTGFKGSWLSLWLQQLGASVVGYSLAPPTKPSLFDIAQVSYGMHHTNGDILDLPHLQNVCATHRPEIVIHMAAQSLVRKSYLNPVETFATNVMGTVNLLEVVRKTPSVRAVVVVTTDKCYENQEWHWGYRENEPMGGYDPYSNSKACAELVSASYRASFFNSATHSKHGVALATARAGNVIGGGDWASDRLVPDILNAFEHKKELVIRNPTAIRPWQHVLEPLRGYLSLAELLYTHGSSFAEAWNFGPTDDDAMPVNELVSKLAKLWGCNPTWKIESLHQPHEATYLKLDISKARARIDWQPKLRLDAALELVVDWTKQKISGADMRQLTLLQIQTYQYLVSKQIK